MGSGKENQAEEEVDLDLGLLSLFWDGSVELVVEVLVAVVVVVVSVMSTAMNEDVV